ncbi:glycoside hydrolase family 43 protein [Auriculariales sp. MPI-PUGE-AT-0066]|nr:glycoside hydrolase family 43 protein [Auriculariales sp. MPI-PUGE-AT-0066]
MLLVKLATAVVVIASALVTAASPLDRRATYTNPVKPGGGADPWVIKIGDSYFMTYTTGGDIRVTRSSNLAQWAETGVQVWAPNGQDYGSIWAPELHVVNGTFYIYAAMTRSNGNNADHRMFAFRGRSTTDPLQAFDLVSQVTSPDNNWAIDGTFWQHTNGKMYFIWSGWTSAADQLNQYLYIAPMDSPTHISGSRVLLHSPSFAWQRSGSNGVNEGPEILVSNGRTFLVYSAAGSWTSQYCLALMGIDGSADPLNPSSWWRVDDRPIMSTANGVYGPGHASFVKDRAGKDYIVYHADATATGGWDGRTIRVEPFKWNADSSPWLPSPPSPFGVTFDLPA